MTDHLYKLGGVDGHDVIACDSDSERGVLDWARWFETADTTVADESFGVFRVATHFLGVNYRHFGKGAPLVFETMVFGEVEKVDPLFGPIRAIQCMERCSTWAEAEAQHRLLAQRFRSALVG